MSGTQLIQRDSLSGLVTDSAGGTQSVILFINPTTPLTQLNDNNATVSVKYTLSFDGTNYNMMNWATGILDYTTTVLATAVTNLQTVLNNSSTVLPTVVIVAPGINWSTSQVSTYGSYWSLVSEVQTNATSNRPSIGQITLGVTGHTTLMQGIMIDGLAVAEVDFFNYASMQQIYCNDLTFTTTGGTGAQGIVFDQTKSTGGIDYIYFTGVTTIVHGNSTGAASGPYPQGVITWLGSVAATNQFYFEHLTVTNHAGQSGTCSVFSILPNAVGNLTGRIWVNQLDLNWNGTETAGFVVWYGTGSAATNNYGIWFGQVTIENHIAGTIAILGMGVNSGGIASSVFINSLLNTYNASNNLWLIYDAGTTYNNIGSSRILTLKDIQLTAVATNGFSWGTFTETLTAPVYVGTAQYHAGLVAAPLSSGAIVATPLTGGNVISLGGSASTWASGTVYTCGGTPVELYFSGGATVTVTQIAYTGGATILAAITPTTGVGYKIEPTNTVTITWTSAPTIVVTKGT